jgi:UDP-N-acetylglucosamine--N-acetylmuramyl-(pentapeptide) pyrophosphoryl-undecaprenol N-acetylglucosamine transferase
LLGDLRAAAVVGLGGFESVPLVWAANKLGLPVVLMEPNAVPSRATSWLSRRASFACLSHPEAAKRLPRRSRWIDTGNPVRSEISQLATGPGYYRDSPVLLVLGGSQGSTAVNRAMIGCVAQDPEAYDGWKIVHQAGGCDAESVRRRYTELGVTAHVEPFLENIAEHYRRARLVVSRAGGSTLAELACAGLPSILLPASRSARDRQCRNARVFEAVGAAHVIRQSPQPEVARLDLQASLESLLNDAPQRERMARAARSLARPMAAVRVAAEILRELAAARRRSVPSRQRATSHPSTTKKLST